MYTYYEVNEKINHSPLVLFFRVFEPIKEKTDIVGFWKDEAGKVHRDNIQLYVRGLIFKEQIENKIESLFCRGEKAVFYKNPYNEGIIEYPDGKRDILKNRIAWTQKHLNAAFIKLLLNQHGGLTVYRIKDGYLIEIYK